MGGGFQPLSWWAQQGYDVEAVEARGEQKSHDVFGTVYYVGIERDKVKQTIHSQLLSLEQQVKKRGPKQKNLQLQAGEARTALPGVKEAVPESTAAEESASAAPSALKGAEAEEPSGADYSLGLDKELEFLLEAEIEPCGDNAKRSGCKRKHVDKEAKQAARQEAKAAAKAKAAALQQAVDTCKTWLEAASQCAGGRSKAALDFDAALLKLRLKAWSDLATRLRKDAPKKAGRKAAKGGA